MSSVAGDAITALAQSVLGALGHAVEWASTLWVGIGTPPVADAAGQATGTVAFLQQNLLVFTTGAGGAVHAARRRADRLPRAQGRAAARARPLPGDLRAGLRRGRGRGERADRRVLIRWRPGSSAARAPARGSLIISRTCSASRPRARLRRRGAPAGFTVGLAGTVTTAFIAIVLGIIAFLATVIQIMLMLVRGGMLVLLVGTLPLVAAFSNTEMGHAVVPQGLARGCSRSRLYKPAAAIVYAVAFDLAGQQGALALLDGVMMLVLAILALPALLRFVVPATSALAGGGGAGGMLAGAAGGAIAMRMPTGAAPVASTPGERLRARRSRRRPVRRRARRRRARRATGTAAATSGHAGPGRARREAPGGASGGATARGDAAPQAAPARPAAAAAPARRAAAAQRERGEPERRAAGAVVQAYGAGKQAAAGGAVESSNATAMTATGRPARPGSPS